MAAPKISNQSKHHSVPPDAEINLCPNFHGYPSDSWTELHTEKVNPMTCHPLGTINVREKKVPIHLAEFDIFRRTMENDIFL